MCRYYIQDPSNNILQRIVVDAFVISGCGYNMHPHSVHVHHSGSSRSVPVLERYGGSYRVQRSAVTGATGTPYIGFYVFSRPDRIESLVLFRAICTHTEDNQNTIWCLRSVDWADVVDAQQQYQCVSLNFNNNLY